MIGHRRIGHDGCGIGVDEYGLDAVFSQRTKRLGTGVIKLAGLADDDRAGADN